MTYYESDENMARRLQQDELDFVRSQRISSLNHGSFHNEEPFFIVPPRPPNSSVIITDGGAARQVQRNAAADLANARTRAPRLLIFQLVWGIIEVTLTCLALGLSWNKTCDRPLNVWMIGHTGRYIFLIPMYLRRLKNIPETESEARLYGWVQLLSFGWFIAGQTWLFGAESCKNTAPFLYGWTVCLIITIYISMMAPLIFLLGICLCLPCVLLFMRYFTPNPGASTTEISRLETFKYDPNTYKERKARMQNQNSDIEAQISDQEQQSSERQQLTPEDQPSCSICMEDYKLNDELRALPCKHDFHKECLDRWLPINSTCPLCRGSIFANNNNINNSISQDVELSAS